MHRTLMLAATVPAALALALAACGGDDAPRRTVQITQSDDACAPAAIDVTAGERLTFEIKNQGKKDHEVEGIDGTKLEELLVPSGRTRTLDYTVPKSGGTPKIKCYIPGGSSTVIELKVPGVSGAAPHANDESASARLTSKPAKEVVTVRLVEYSVQPDRPSVPAGPVKFVARNASATEAHELVVLRALPSGGFEKAGEIEDLKAKSARLQAEIDAYRHRVDLFNPKKLDPDILTERARALLDMSAPGDIVVMVDPATGLPLLGAEPALDSARLSSLITGAIGQ